MGKWKWNTKDNLILRSLIITLSIAIIVAFRFITPINGLSQSAMAVIGTFIGVLLLWLTISIDWPSLLCILVLGTIDGLNFKTLFMSSFGNDTFVFLLCTFICTYALSKTSILKRISIWFISNKLAKKGPWFFISMFCFSIITIGSFISPSVLFIIMLPILEEIYSIAHIEKGEKIASVLMIALAFCVSISSGMTPIAHVFPIIAMGTLQLATGFEIGYGQYMLICIPVGIVLTILLILTLKIVFRPDVSKLKNIDVSSLKKDLTKIGKNEIITLVIFCFMILLWVLPNILKPLLPDLYNTINGFGTAFPAIIGVILLSVITHNKKPLVSIKDACQNGVPFPSLIMCAGTLALGSAMTSEAIGLKAFLVNNISSSISSFPFFALLVIFAVWTIIQTNLSSNMVTATVVSTVAVPVVTALYGNSAAAIIIVVIGMLSAFAFATPPSMPHIAIAAGSGWTSTKDVFLIGSILCLLSVLLSIAIAYPLGLLIL